MSQIALPLDWPAGETQQDFIVGDSNAAAVRHLDHWGAWPVMATILTGPRKSGRSLLGRVFARKTGGRLIDEADQRDEESLFHAWNAAQEQRLPLLMIADAPPPAWRVRLPDLRSRLGATPAIALGDPDDQLARALIEKLLGQRNLFPPPELLNWLVPRVERTHVALIRVVDALDEAALSRRTRLSLKLARATLSELRLIDGQEDSA
jgi:chromosomal replication initiation ATPase DnaA